MAIKEYSKTDRTKLSTNFRVSEFACHGKKCCTTVLIDDQLVEYLQKIRDHFKKSVTLTSGYRCPIHNKNIGGATGSRHSKGQAADIVVRGVTPAEVAKYAESIGIKGIGLYEAKDGNFVHIDTRTTKSFWYGHAQVYRSTFGGAVQEVDPKAGLKEFVKEIQAAIDAKVDGIAGPETLSKTPTVSWKKNNRHAVVKIVQKRLHDLGYVEVGKADGVAGSKFASAVMHFQQDNGCVVDGEITSGKATWKKLLGMK